MIESEPIKIIYQDEYFIVVSKPINLPVHKNDFMPKDAMYLNKIIGQMTGKGVYNVHRLDSKTSGLIILAFSSEIAHSLCMQFEQKIVKKVYFAITRMIPPESGSFDEKVFVKQKGKKANAVTHYKTLFSITTNISYKELENVPLSLVQITPETGKWHQIRQHFSKNRFEIIGDTHHGDWTLNKIIAEKTGIKRLFLHASEITFLHPIDNQIMIFKDEIPLEFNQVLNILKI